MDVIEAICDELRDKNPPDSHNYTPLHAASNYGKLPVVKFLVRFVPNVDIRTDDYLNNRTPLYLAAGGGHLDTVKFLIEKGADPKLKSKIGFTPLHYAARWGYLDIVKFLKEKGELIEKKIKRGEMMMILEEN